MEDRRAQRYEEIMFDTCATYLEALYVHAGSYRRFRHCESIRHIYGTPYKFMTKKGSKQSLWAKVVGR